MGEPWGWKFPISYTLMPFTLHATELPGATLLHQPEYAVKTAPQELKANLARATISGSCSLLSRNILRQPHEARNRFRRETARVD